MRIIDTVLKVGKTDLIQPAKIIICKNGLEKGDNLI